MASQTGKNISLAFKVQSALGTPATGASGTGIDVRPSSGLAVKFAQAVSQLIRRDGMSVKPRQGSRSVTGAYETELIVDALDDIFQAVLRGTWVASADITNATSSLGSATITGSGATITAGGGSWITAGVRKGMMVKFSNMSTAANNGKWFPVLGVTAGVITTKAGILTDQALDATFTLTIARQLIQGNPPTERYYSVDQYLQDIDLSLSAQDCKFHSIVFQAAPDQPISIGFDITGRDADLAAAGSSPVLTSPTFVTAKPLYLADGAIYINGVAVANITGFRFALTVPASLQAVIGSRLSPDVFLGNAVLSGEMMLTVEDDTFFNYSLNETDLSVLLHCAEREADPADFVSFYLGNLSTGDFGIPIGAEGAMVQTFPIVGGIDEGGALNGYAPTMVLISTSAT